MIHLSKVSLPSLSRTCPPSPAASSHSNHLVPQLTLGQKEYEGLTNDPVDSLTEYFKNFVRGTEIVDGWLTSRVLTDLWIENQENVWFVDIGTFLGCGPRGRKHGEMCYEGKHHIKCQTGRRLNW